MVASYLCRRKQFVSIGESASPAIDVGMRVPQGSTFGALFFLMHINYMHSALAWMDVIHFADDSTLYMKFNKTSNISDQVNSSWI